MISLVCAGGGTLGPVTPLLAVIEAWRARGEVVKVTWLGTTDGPEKEFVAADVQGFYALPKARLTRYPSSEWLTAWFSFCKGFWMAWKMLRKMRPHVVASAGGFTAVPVVLAARWLGIPVWVHQPDVRTLLSTRLTARFASLITCAWSETITSFPQAHLVGNPVRPSLLRGNVERAMRRFELHPTRPTVLVIGGGTGAMSLNERLGELAPWLAVRANVIHLMGKGKEVEVRLPDDGVYRTFSLLQGEAFADALAVADVVVSRGGMGAISECAAAKKAVIFVPLSGSQAVNTSRVAASHAAISTSPDVSSGELQHHIHKLLSSPDERRCLAERLARLLPASSASHTIDLIRHQLIR